MMQHPFTNLLYWMAMVKMWVCIGFQVLELMSQLGWVLVLPRRGYRA